jgi:hypothetical protein
VTSTTIDQVCVPATGRDARVLTWVRDRAIDGLAGRTVWCVAALPSRRPAAQKTNAHLEWAREGGVSTDAPAITTARGAGSLAERLDGLLRGRAAAAELGPSDRRAFAEVVEDGDRWVRGHVAPDDIVILHDALTVALTESVRARGAHAVWHLGIARTARAATVAEALAFLQRYAPPGDAYVVSWSQPVARGGLVGRMAAMMPAPGVVATTELLVEDSRSQGGRQWHDDGWAGALGSVVEFDRRESVGGRLHARPGVAAR